MKKKFLALLIFISLVGSILPINTIYAAEQEIQYIDIEDIEDGSYFELRLAPEDGQNLERATTAEIVLVGSMKKEDGRIKINCANVSDYIILDIVFNVMLTGRTQHGGYWSHTFERVKIDYMPPKSISQALTYTISVLFNEPLFAEALITCNLNGTIYSSNLLLYW